MKRYIASFILALAVSSPASAQMMAPTAQATLDTPTYRATAAAGDSFEIESSRLALERSRNPRVRNFANQMIREHTMTSQALMGGVQVAGLGMMAPVLDSRRAAMLSQLSAASGAQFDRLYGQMQLMAHDEALALHAAYAQGGADPAHRAFAQQVLPHLRQHRDMASRLPGSRN